MYVLMFACESCAWVLAESPAFVCSKDGCGAAFVCYNHLRRHMAVAHPLSCEECQLVFRDKYSLDQHMAIHARKVVLACFFITTAAVVVASQLRLLLLVL
jgi:hypothetical protein